MKVTQVSGDDGPLCYSEGGERVRRPQAPADRHKPVYRELAYDGVPRVDVRPCEGPLARHITDGQALAIFGCKALGAALPRGSEPAAGRVNQGDLRGRADAKPGEVRGIRKINVVTVKAIERLLVEWQAFDD